MAGKRWAVEELRYLEDNCDSRSTRAMAKYLGRSENAIRLKCSRLGYQMLKNSTDMLSSNALAEIMGVDNRTIAYWHRNGLKYRRLSGIQMHQQEVVVKWLKEHQDMWSSLRGDMYLVQGKKWFKEKREKDLQSNLDNHLKNWSSLQEQRLVYLKRKGYSRRQLAGEFKKTPAAIRNKLHELRTRGVNV